jgi:DNA-binding Lrp family transcriptional regulator
MSKFSMSESAELDTLDLKIIQGLQVGPRLPFARIAEVLGVSEQTVARRYRRLRGSGIMRVVAMVNPRRLGQSDWFVRVGCRPGSATRLAEALARRDDVSWVTISAGGSELVCSVRSLTSRQRDDLLQRLPAAGQVLTLTAHEIMYRFAGGIAQDWTGYGGPLHESQIAALTAPPVPEPDGPVTLTPGDGTLLAALGRDGRASYATLAAETGWTQGVAARRLELLRAAGVLYFDIDLATQVMGFASSAYLWLTVEPARLEETGELLAGHAEVPFVSAITGACNLIAAVICRDTEALYRYVTTRIGAAPGVRQLEISPVLRRVKQAGTWMDGPRLAVAPRRPAQPVPAAARA